MKNIREMAERFLENSSLDLDFQYSQPEAHHIFNKFRDACIALVTIENKHGLLDYLKSMFKEITDDYRHIKQAFGEFRDKKSVTSQDPIPPATQRNVRLPELDLPTFRGITNNGLP